MKSEAIVQKPLIENHFPSMDRLYLYKCHCFEVNKVTLNEIIVFNT